MTTKKKESTARWMEKDGKVELQADSEAAKAQGWTEPKGVRPNGEPYNPEPVDGITPQAEFVAKLHEANAEAEAERAAKREAEAAKSAPAVPEPQPAPDLRVQIVDPAKEPAKPAAKKK